MGHIVVYICIYIRIFVLYCLVLRYFTNRDIYQINVYDQIRYAIRHDGCNRY